MFSLPRCSNCGNVMTSGEECRYSQAWDYCFACTPHNRYAGEGRCDCAECKLWEIQEGYV